MIISAEHQENRVIGRMLRESPIIESFILRSRSPSALPGVSFMSKPTTSRRPRSWRGAIKPKLWIAPGRPAAGKKVIHFYCRNLRGSLHDCGSRVGGWAGLLGRLLR